MCRKCRITATAITSYPVKTVWRGGSGAMLTIFGFGAILSKGFPGPTMCRAGFSVASFRSTNASRTSKQLLFADYSSWFYSCLFESPRHWSLRRAGRSVGYCTGGTSLGARFRPLFGLLFLLTNKSVVKQQPPPPSKTITLFVSNKVSIS